MIEKRLFTQSYQSSRSHITTTTSTTKMLCHSTSTENTPVLLVYGWHGITKRKRKKERADFDRARVMHTKQILVIQLVE